MGLLSYLCLPPSIQPIIYYVVPFMLGIDLVSMVTGLSIRKPDDASSVADSAIATGIATFTGVSRYSEVRCLKTRVLWSTYPTCTARQCHCSVHLVRPQCCILAQYALECPISVLHLSMHRQGGNMS